MNIQCSRSQWLSSLLLHEHWHHGFEFHLGYGCGQLMITPGQWGVVVVYTNLVMTVGRKWEKKGKHVVRPWLCSCLWQSSQSSLPYSQIITYLLSHMPVSLHLCSLMKEEALQWTDSLFKEVLPHISKQESKSWKKGDIGLH